MIWEKKWNFFTPLTVTTGFSMKSHLFKLSMRKKCLANVNIFYSGEQEGLACAEEVKVKVKTREKR